MKAKVKVGLEWHQRLRSRKLFCHCPSNLNLEPEHWITRKLRISSSELGELDPAAAVEAARGRVFNYGFNGRSSCLVELDEAPPFPINEEALMVALKMALYFKMMVVDEVRVMRKTVIDGSNTSGFQRTALVAVGTPESYIRTSEGDVRLSTLCLEEESAFIIEKGGAEVSYKLDRLAIPLVELATAPDIRSPEQAEELAEEVGLRMRLTGDVQRGLGTIRQDINISVEGGSRQEIKGVQDLKLIPKIVELEIQRQNNLLQIRDDLRGKGASHFEMDVVNLKETLRHSRCEIISSSLKAGGTVAGIKLPRFAGVLGREIQPGRRFGTELADYAKVWGGVWGIMHSDEMPKYGLSENDLREVRMSLKAGPEDAFVIVVGDEDRVRRALTAVYERAISALSGVPSETRRSNEDGTTSYMRPLPGPSRMYPETDVPPVVITTKMLSEAIRRIPPLPSEKLEQFKSMGLTEHMAAQMLRSPASQLFEEAVAEGADAVSAASILLNTLPFLRREGVNIDNIPEENLKELLVSFGRSGLPRELVEDVLRIMSSGKTPQDAYRELSERLVGEAELRSFIKELLESKPDLVKSRGPEQAHKALMGVVMSRYRGRVSGNLVSKILWEYLREVS